MGQYNVLGIVRYPYIASKTISETIQIGNLVELYRIYIPMWLQVHSQNKLSL